MRRQIAIPLLYLLTVSILFTASALARLPALALLPYGLTLPWSLFVGLLIPNQWILIPVSCGAVLNAGYIYGYLSKK
jgi:hypothetical protein